MLLFSLAVCISKYLLVHTIWLHRSWHKMCRQCHTCWFIVWVDICIILFTLYGWKPVIFVLFVWVETCYLCLLCLGGDLLSLSSLSGWRPVIFVFFVWVETCYLCLLCLGGDLLSLSSLSGWRPVIVVFFVWVETCYLCLLCLGGDLLSLSSLSGWRPVIFVFFVWVETCYLCLLCLGGDLLSLSSLSGWRPVTFVSLSGWRLVLFWFSMQSISFVLFFRVFSVQFRHFTIYTHNTEAFPELSTRAKPTLSHMCHQQPYLCHYCITLTHNGAIFYGVMSWATVKFPFSVKDNSVAIFQKITNDSKFD